MPVVHLEILGRVQGVGFRWFVRQQARGLGLAGWVRNRADGAVELAASGSDEEVQRLVELVSEGPAGARVEAVRELPTSTVGDLPNPFSVER